MRPSDPLWQYLGFQASGDLAGYTVYTSRRGKLVMFTKSPPLKPASGRQRILRNRLKLSSEIWQTMTPTEKQRWNAAADAAALRITGYNLFTFWALTGDEAIIDTIARQTGIDPRP